MDFLFSQTGNGFQPADFAAGPFNNLHGGAAAAIMAADVLKDLPIGFMPVSMRCEFLHSTPLSEFKLDVMLSRDGRRHRVYDISLKDRVNGKTTARSTLTCYNPISTDLIEPAETQPWGGHAAPTEMPTMPDMPSPSGGANWMICATDVRTDLKGVFWFRWRGSLMQSGWDHWFTRILGPSDWVGGFVAPGFPLPEKTGVWPNTDLTVHVERPLIGDWIGLKPTGNYHATGFGVGHAELLDAHGRVGHALASVISPLRPIR